MQTLTTIPITHWVFFRTDPRRSKFVVVKDTKILSPSTIAFPIFSCGTNSRGRASCKFPLKKQEFIKIIIIKSKRKTDKEKHKLFHKNYADLRLVDHSRFLLLIFRFLLQVFVEERNASLEWSLHLNCMCQHTQYRSIMKKKKKKR